MMESCIIKNKKLLSLLCALFCTAALSFGHIVGKNPLIDSGNVIAILFYILFFILFLKMIESGEKRDYKIGMFFGFIFACCTSIGAEFMGENTIRFRNIFFYLNIIALTLIYNALLILLFNNMSKIKEKLYTFKIPKAINNILDGADFKTYLFILITILICWIPVFLALYPGYFSYDGPIQIEQFYNSHVLNAWHPVVHTLSLVSCFEIGNFLFGNYSAGLTLYCCLQALIVASVFSYLGICMLKWKVPKIIVVLGMIFLIFNPIIQIFAFMTTKDVIFGALFLLLILYTINLMLNIKAFYCSNLLMIRYTAVVILMGLFRKQGIYVFIVFIPAFIWISKEYWKKALVISVTSIMAVFLFLGPISNALGIVKGPVNEALSLPLQQIARVMNVNPDSVTEDEKNQIYEYIPQEALANYIPEISDPVKDNFNGDKFIENKMDFIKLYFNLGIRNPGIYFDEFIYATLGYFYPSVESVNPWGGVMDYYTSSTISIEQNSMFPLYLKYLHKAGNSFFRKIPILSFCVCEAFPFWILMTSAAVLFKEKRYHMLIPLSIIFIYWCSLLLGPVCCIRYVYPLLTYIPLIISIPFINNLNKN